MQFSTKWLISIISAIFIVIGSYYIFKKSETDNVELSQHHNDQAQTETHVNELSQQQIELNQSYNNFLEQKIQEYSPKTSEQWLSQWPAPQNKLEQMFLGLLAVGEKSPHLFDEELSQLIEHLQEQENEQVHRLTQTLLDYLELSHHEEFYLFRSHIFKFNARFAVDERLSSSLLEDLKRLKDENDQLTEVQARSYFDALTESHDLGPDIKYLHATSLLHKASLDDQTDMLLQLNEEVIPLLPE
jgi:hypothetical protein